MIKAILCLLLIYNYNPYHNYPRWITDTIDRDPFNLKDTLVQTGKDLQLIDANSIISWESTWSLLLYVSSLKGSLKDCPYLQDLQWLPPRELADTWESINLKEKDSLDLQLDFYKESDPQKFEELQTRKEDVKYIIRELDAIKWAQSPDISFSSRRIYLRQIKDAIGEANYYAHCFAFYPAYFAERRLPEIIEMTPQTIQVKQQRPIVIFPY